MKSRGPESRTVQSFTDINEPGFCELITIIKKPSVTMCDRRLFYESYRNLTGCINFECGFLIGIAPLSPVSRGPIDAKFRRRLIFQSLEEPGLRELITAN